MDSNTRLEEAAENHTQSLNIGDYDHTLSKDQIEYYAKIDFKAGAEWQAKELAGEQEERIKVLEEALRDCVERMDRGRSFLVKDWGDQQWQVFNTDKPKEVLYTRKPLV